jgi:hypothetical protein
VFVRSQRHHWSHYITGDSCSVWYCRNFRNFIGTMSQVGVSRPSTGMSVGGKPGFNLPAITHPLSRLGDPGKLDVRGVSRGCDRPMSHAGSISGRPLANEGNFSPRKSVSAGGRYSKLSKSSPMPALQYDSIPEGVEVMQGDPSKTRLPVFGKCHHIGLSQQIYNVYIYSPVK